jgi:protein-tyrosine phosphatase
MVCEGNICRSPVAEALLRRALEGTVGVHVTSAGMRARVGSPVEQEMAQLLGDAAPVDFAARQVTGALVNGADLVLAMTRDQRSALVQLAPGCLRRTFTLREFAELALLVRHDRPAAAGSAAEALAELTVLAPKHRDRREAGRRWDDVEDPFGRSAEEHARAYGLIQSAVRNIAVACVGVGGVPVERPLPAPRHPVPEARPGVSG